MMLVKTIDKQYFWDKVSFISFLLSVIILYTHTINNVMGKIGNDAFADTFMMYCHGFQGQAVQMFWMISAALFFRDFDYNKVRTKYKSRFHSLVIPFILWNILGMLFYGFIGAVPVLKSLVNQLVLPTWEFADVLEGVFHYKFNIIFWFIYDLLLLVLFSPIIYSFIRNKWTALFFIVGVEFLAIHYKQYFYSARCPEGWYSYFIAAYIGLHYFDKMQYSFNKIVNLSLFAIGIVMMGIMVFVPNKPFMLHIILSLGISFCLWYGFELLFPLYRKWMKGMSMFVYAIHFNLSMVVSKLLIMIPIPFSMNTTIHILAILFVATTITLFLSVSIGLLLKKYIPQSYYMLTGGR